jgi:hypothetical protein
MGIRRRSGQGIVHSEVDVKKWTEQLPTAQAVRPRCCSGCGAASCPHGQPIVLMGHGTRERQVRGPLGPGMKPGILVLRVRRYRCRRCGDITTVLPRGLLARRYYSAGAIALGLLLLGVMGESVQRVRDAICAWAVSFESPGQWNTLGKWVAAVTEKRLYPQVRPWPPGFRLRQKAERVATTLLTYAPMALSEQSLQEQVFAGAGLAA